MDTIAKLGWASPTEGEAIDMKYAVPEFVGPQSLRTISQGRE